MQEYQLCWPCHSNMERVVILGPGASGKSALAVRLGEITGLPRIELDKIFWRPGLTPTPPQEWAELQRMLIEKSRWIMDGDLGPYDVVEVRLRAADTIVFLDFSRLRCAWRALWRSRERLDFWLWLLRYRSHSRPLLMKAIMEHGAHAKLHVIGNPAGLRRFLMECARNC